MYKNHFWRGKEGSGSHLVTEGRRGEGGGGIFFVTDMNFWASGLFCLLQWVWLRWRPGAFAFTREKRERLSTARLFPQSAE